VTGTCRGAGEPFDTTGVRTQILIDRHLHSGRTISPEDARIMDSRGYRAGVQR
jgi:hypothetical protein